MAYIPDSGSVAAWLQSDAASVITVQKGSIATVIVGGSIAATFTPPANQSVSGTVGASVIGHAPVVIVGGSIAASFTPPANQSVSGTVQAGLLSTNASVISYIQNSVATVIIGGSIAATFTPPANQSVSGTVHIDNLSSIIAYQLAGSVLATSATVNPAANQSVSGTVHVDNFSSVVAYQLAGSVLAVSGSFSPAGNQSVSGTVGASVIGLTPIGLVTPGTGATNLGKAQDSPAGATDSGVANLMVQTSTLAALGQADNDYIVQRGDKYGNTWVSMGTKIDPVNDAILVYQGSIFATTAVGSIISLNVGSVITIQQAPSIVGTYAEDSGHTTADKGLFALGVRNDTMASVASADLDYTINAVDSQGRTIVKPFTPNDGTLIEYQGSVVSGSVQLIQASAIGKRNYVTDISMSNTGATTTLLTLQGGDTSILGQYIVPTGGGSNLQGINIPLRTTLSQDLAFKVSPSSSVVYINVRGYQGQ